MPGGRSVQMGSTWDGGDQVMCVGAGVSTSASPLTTTVLAVMDAIVWYWSKRLRLGKKPAAVVNGVVEMAAATAARAFRSALASPGSGKGFAHRPHESLDCLLRSASGHVVNEFKQHPCGGSGEQVADSSLGDPACRGCDQDEALRFHRTVHGGAAEVCQRRHAAHRVSRRGERALNVQSGEELGEVAARRSIRYVRIGAPVERPWPRWS